MPEAVQRNKNQEELTDLQIEHSRKRKKLVSEQDTDIQSLKQTFVKQKEAATEQGDAAVNHIKKNQTAELERAQASREKTQGRAQKQTAEIEDSYKNKIEQVKESRQATVERVRADTQKKVNETETFSNKKLEEIRSHSNSDMKIAQDRYNKQIDNMKTSTRDRIAEITAESDKAIKAELAEGTAKKEEVRDHNQKDVTQLEKQGQASISDEKQVLENRKLHLNKEYEKTFNRQQEAWM